MSRQVLVDATKIVAEAQHRINRKTQLYATLAICALAVYAALWLFGLAGFAYWMWSLAQ